MNLGEIMETRILSLEESTTIKDAASAMAERNVGFVLVTQGDEVTGVFSERDILKRVVPDELDTKSTPISQVMTSKITKAPVKTTPGEAVEIMTKGRFRHLPVCDDDGKIVGIVGIRDVLQRNLENEHSARMTSLAMMSQGIAHEVNNPVVAASGIIARMDMALQKGDLNSEKLSEQITKLDEMVKRIGTIIKGLRSFSHEEKNEPQSAITMAGLLDRVLVLYRQKIEDAGIDLRLPNQVAMDTEFLCRPSQLSHALSNLLDNAIEAVNSVDQKWIEIQLDRCQKSKAFQIIMTDSGPGVEAGLHRKIFEPFFSTKPTNQGSGLGLSIAHSVALDHDGKLFLDPQREHTTFIFEFPGF